MRAVGRQIQLDQILQDEQRPHHVVDDGEGFRHRPWTGVMRGMIRTGSQAMVMTVSGVSTAAENRSYASWDRASRDRRDSGPSVVAMACDYRGPFVPGYVWAPVTPVLVRLNDRGRKGGARLAARARLGRAGSDRIGSAHHIGGCNEVINGGRPRP